jgi:hypothetical protein
MIASPVYSVGTYAEAYDAVQSAVSERSERSERSYAVNQVIYMHR